MLQLILSPIADKIIGSLASAAVKEIATLWGVNEELEGLQKTISLLSGVLLDAEEKQVHNHGVRIWLKSLADAVHEADHLMDEFDTEALRRRVMPGNGFSKQVCTFFSASNQLAFRHKMGRRIKEIKTKLDAASSNRTFILEVRSPDQESRVTRKRETHSFVRQDEVIGRDEDREEIVKLLLESQFEENVSVIPILGMGGLGKTTLAQSVFNDERVQQHFEPKAWVCVSDPFDLKVIVQTIIKSVDPKYKLREVEIDQLQLDLRKMLDGKRYLLVLDDVWEENRESWLKLETLLKGGAKGSRVVVTTRSKAVAKATSPLIEPYQLGVLDEEKSWSLFKKMAFGKEQEEESSNLVVIGKEIVKRCGGIPLAIRTIGSTLCCKRSETEWSSFNKEFLKLPQGDDILPTLRLSYDNLTAHLKQCFAYCRLFPKDYDIDVSTLIQLWMAQGFLKLSDQCLEDVGYGYFVDLSERSFFQEIETDEFGVAKSCKMHDLIHDLAIESAGEGYDNINSNSKNALIKNVYHVSLSCPDVNSVRQMLTSSLQVRKIRTVLSLSFFDGENELKPISSPTISNFNQIRTLGLESLGHTIELDSIHRLKFVRYLDLSWTKSIKTLPKSITNLLNLQTLKLNHCSKLQELPRDLNKLVNLRHLEIDSCTELRHMPIGLGQLNLQTLKLNCCNKLEELPRDLNKLVNLRHLEIDSCTELRHMPVGLSQLTNLTTLSMYVLPTKSSDYASRHSGELKELMVLSNLRGELEITNLRHEEEAATESKSANLKEKRHLRSLSLSWDFNIDATEGNITGYEMSLEGLQPHPNLKKLYLRNYGGVKISSWLQSLTNLVSLSLWSCKNCKHLDPMSQLHNIKKLRLSSLPSLEYITNSYNDNNLLTSLQNLDLVDLPSVKGWWGKYVVSEEENQHKPLPSFPQLTQLYIENCPNLNHMPLYPHVEGSLIIRNASLKPFQQTMLETCSFSPLSKLKSLRICKVGDLECLPDWFKGLTSLTRLAIVDWPQLKDLCPGILYLTSLTCLEFRDCRQLKDLCPGILYLTSLKELRIGKCEELVDTLHNAIMWKALNGRLQSLTLSEYQKMESLPEGIQHVTSLQYLGLFFFDGLKTIPEWIGNLISLKNLECWDCPNLTSLPEGIRSLTSLERLEINDCPILLKRCQREDWPKIAHIPHLSLDSDPDEDSGSGETLVALVY